MNENRPILMLTMKEMMVLKLVLDEELRQCATITTDPNTAGGWTIVAQCVQGVPMVFCADGAPERERIPIMFFLLAKTARPLPKL